MIRSLNLDDVKEFTGLLVQSLENSSCDFSSVAYASSIPSEEDCLKILKRQNPVGGNFIFGYFSNSTLLGVIGVDRSPRSSVSHKGGLKHFYVDPEHRNQKIGKKLLQATIEHVSKDNTCRYLRGGISAEWHNAKTILESLGFYSYGIEPLGIYNGEKLFDRVYYRLETK